MRYIWTPNKDNLAPEFKIAVSGNKSIILKKDEEYAFSSEAEFKPFQDRLERLMAAGEVKLLSRSYMDSAKAVAKEEDKTSEAEEAADSQEQSEETAQSKELADMSVAELKALATARGLELPKKATKAELLAALEA